MPRTTQNFDNDFLNETSTRRSKVEPELKAHYHCSQCKQIIYLTNAAEECVFHHGLVFCKASCSEKYYNEHGEEKESDDEDLETLH